MAFPQLRLTSGDALILVDIQNDFLPGGSLEVPDGDQIIEPVNRVIELFRKRGLPVFATRDWHPPDHRSFLEQGGPWPRHCVARTRGAEFPPILRLPAGVHLISKATRPERDAYSGFEETDLDEKLRKLDVSRLFVGGLATDYCVLNTVKDALSLGYRVYLLKDAIRPVNVRPDDEQKALVEMQDLGAIPVTTSMISEASADAKSERAA